MNLKQNQFQRIFDNVIMRPLFEFQKEFHQVKISHFNAFKTFFEKAS